MTTDIDKKFKEDIQPAESTDIIATEEQLWLADINDRIKSALEKSLEYANEDRTRSEELFEELRELVTQGASDPDVIREINKAQENIGQSTESIIKILGHLAKIKSGDARIQIAQINQNEKGDGGGLTKADLLDAVDEMEQKGYFSEKN